MRAVRGAPGAGGILCVGFASWSLGLGGGGVGITLLKLVSAALRARCILFVVFFLIYWKMPAVN